MIACARRTQIAYWAIVALGAMRVQLSVDERAALKRIYRRECGGGPFDDCSSFADVMAQSFARPSGRERE